MRLRFRLFLLRKKSASIAFWYQNAACRANPDPNAACGRSVDGQAKAKLETKHRRSRLLRGVGRVVPMCAALQADRARAGLRYTNGASALRGGVKKIE